jgi:DNA-3-methyladenine glycosylase II
MNAVAMTDTRSSTTIVRMLAPRPPFSFVQALTFLRRFPPTEGERPVVGEAVLGATRVGGRTVGFHVEDAGSVDEPGLRCTLHAGDGRKLNDAIVEAALELISGWLGLDDDLGPFYALASADPPFTRLVERMYGYHQVRFFTPFENACWAILGQRTPFAVARAAKRGLALRYGGTITVSGVTCTAFPEPSALAAADPSELQEIVGTERKADRLLAIARAFADAEPAFLASAPTDQLAAWLTTLPGIGPWSVSFILLRGFGRPDTTLPIGNNATFEKEILGAARAVYGDTLTVEQLAAIAERYDAWRGYWGHYLRAG